MFDAYPSIRWVHSSSDVVVRQFSIQVLNEREWVQYFFKHIADCKWHGCFEYSNLSFKIFLHDRRDSHTHVLIIDVDVSHMSQCFNNRPMLLLTLQKRENELLSSTNRPRISHMSLLGTRWRKSLLEWFAKDSNIAFLYLRIIRIMKKTLTKRVLTGVGIVLPWSPTFHTLGHACYPLPNFLVHVRHLWRTGRTSSESINGRSRITIFDIALLRALEIMCAKKTPLKQSPIFAESRFLISIMMIVRYSTIERCTNFGWNDWLRPWAIRSDVSSYPVLIHR